MYIPDVSQFSSNGVMLCSGIWHPHVYPSRTAYLCAKFQQKAKEYDAVQLSNGVSDISAAPPMRSLCPLSRHLSNRSHLRKYPCGSIHINPSQLVSLHLHTKMRH